MIRSYMTKTLLVNTQTANNTINNWDVVEQTIKGNQDICYISANILRRAFTEKYDKLNSTQTGKSYIFSQRLAETARKQRKVGNFSR